MWLLGVKLVKVGTWKIWVKHVYYIDNSVSVHGVEGVEVYMISLNRSSIKVAWL